VAGEGVAFAPRLSLFSGVNMADTVPDPGQVEFVYVPVFADAGLDIRFAFVKGLSTRREDGHTDRGRMYGLITPSGADAVVTLHSAYDRAADSLQAQGTITAADVAAGNWVDLVDLSQGARVKLAAMPTTAAARKFLIVPTFATDLDVDPDPDVCAAFPGYGGVWGLAMWHAAAMREIMTVGLPSRIPHLFGELGMAAMVPMEEAEIRIPDLRKLASVDSLRIAQANLVKALSAESLYHQDEWRQIADAARARYEKIMDDLGLANAPREETAAEAAPDNSGIGFGTWNRG
jgi:hypothetical protein